MEMNVNDYSLMVAGAAGMLIAIAHGLIGHRKILKHVTGLSPTQRQINYAVFQMSAVYWFASGIALLLAPFFLNPTERSVISVAVAFVYITGAIGNAWITRGRHFGAYALAAVALLALFGR